MKKRSSLKTQIAIILVVFIVSVLGLIYFFQTALLDDFYKNNKISSMEMTAHQIVEKLDDDDLSDVLNEEIISNEVCVRIVSDSFDFMESKQNGGCALWQLTDYQIKRMMSEVEENNDKKLFDNYRFEMYPGNIQDIYIYGEMGEVEDEDVLVLVSSRIVPLDVTTRTIADQYRLIVIIVVAATLILSFVISRLIVRPLKEIEAEARELPQGRYDGRKVKAGNQEMEDLNGTLTKANEEIIKADKAKKELIGNVSHDLRTPLTM
ncbi:MAG: HAMP domain-containing histidine kinase, partial [Erysipelotrichaceae bacterium]|nr:HAMP domain-containing histidine kinase [Erysipelotrichaceae bacterium]